MLAKGDQKVDQMVGWRLTRFMLRSGEIRLSDEDVETLRKAKDAYKGNYSCAS